MKESIINFIVWIGIWVFVGWILSFSALSQWNQGAFTAAVTIILNRILFND